MFLDNDFYDLTKSPYYKHYDSSPYTTRAVAYYARYLLQKAMSVFEWEIPKTWDINYFLYILYTYGYICISDIKPFGIIPQYCTIEKYNVFYNPAGGKIQNPNIRPETIDVVFGENGELLNLTPDYIGILDCIFEYAEMLANASAAVNTNLFNSRLSYVFYAKNKTQADSYKKMYSDITTGTPAVFVDKNLMKDNGAGDVMLPVMPFNSELAKNYLATDILEDMRRIEHMFAQKIGLPNANTEKRERMTDDETNKTDVESLSNVELWFTMIQESITKIKTLYPDLTLSCDFRYKNYMFSVDSSGSDFSDSEDGKNEVE